MNIEDAAGPGIDAWLIDRLATWGIDALTDVQTRALEAGVADGRSLIVCAPTSSGKTLVGEIAVLRGQDRHARSHGGNRAAGSGYFGSSRGGFGLRPKSAGKSLRSCSTRTISTSPFWTR